MPKSIWFNDKVSLAEINSTNKNTIMEHLEIRYQEIGSNYITATMPVDNRTVQPFKMLHGGASCVLAETLGSIASNLTLDKSKQFAVGQSITTNHLRPGIFGEKVFAKATVVHLGSKSHLWNIDIENSDGKIISTTRLTMAVINH